MERSIYVVDNGSLFIRSGTIHQERPSLKFFNALNEKFPSKLLDETIDYFNPEIKSAFHNGEVYDWNIMENIWNLLFNLNNQIPQNTELYITDSVPDYKSQLCHRTKMIEILMEKFKFNTIEIYNQHVKFFLGVHEYLKICFIYKLQFRL